MWQYLRLAAVACTISVFSAGPGGSAVLSEAEFTQLFANTVTELHPEVQANIIDVKHVEIGFPDGNQVTAFLENAYIIYKDDPSQLATVLRDYAENAYQTRHDPTESEGNILPVLRSFSYFSDSGIEIGASNGRGLLHLPLTEDIGIFFVRDYPKHIYYMHNEDLVTLQMEAQELLAASLQTLMLQKHEAKVASGPGFSVLIGDDYASSLILTEHFRKKLPFPYRGRMTVIPVSRTLVLFTGDEESEGIRTAKEYAAKMIDQEPYSISTKPLLLKDGNWQLLQ